MTKRYLLLVTAVVVCATVMGAAEVRAAHDTLTPPRECSITVGNTPILITAGPGHDTSGNPVQFPITVPCPTNLNSDLIGTCLKWNYVYSTTDGSNLALSMLTVDSDIEPIVVTGPNETTTGGTSIKEPGEGATEFPIAEGVYDVRVAKFSQQGSAVGIANVFTRTDVGVGTVTAGSKLGGKTAFCPIAGPDNPQAIGAFGKVALTTEVVTEAGGCTIVTTVDSNGCTLTTTAYPTDETSMATCIVTEENLELNGQPLEGATCDAKLTFGTTTRYCTVKSNGQLSCTCLDTAC